MSASMRITWLALLLGGMALGMAGCRPQETHSSKAEWRERPAFWVWNASRERVAAVSTGHELRWLAVEFPADHEASPRRFIAAVDLAKLAEAVPVFRLPPGDSVLDDAGYQAAVIRVMREWMGTAAISGIELDYDCPTARLADYARFIRRVREQVIQGRVSVTALASWVGAPGFGALESAVDEMTPMFYDLESDDPAEAKHGRYRAMVDEQTLKWIKGWRHCRVPWRAGLPNFRRLSLFRADGSLIGHLRRWDMAALQQASLVPMADAGEGCRVFHATRRTRIAGTVVPEGSRVVWRHPRLLGEAVAAARSAGACGVIWFAHPQSAPVAAHSTFHLDALQAGRDPQPHLVEEIEASGAVVLRNDGEGDLLPREDGRLHEWVVTLPDRRTFEDPGAGSFDEVVAAAGSLLHPGSLREIRLRYHELPAGGELRSSPGTVRVLSGDVAPNDSSD